MIDLELIRNETERVRQGLLKRLDQVSLEPILEADKQRRDIIHRMDEKKAERNKKSKEIGRLRGAGEDSTKLQAETTALKDEIEQLESEAEESKTRLHALMSELPNLPDERVVAGGKEANRVIKTFGEKPGPVSKPKDHVELCTELGLVDYERGTKLGGTGSWIYTGQGAALEWALLNFFCQEHMKDGYTFLLPPHLLLEECGFTTGQFPKFKDDVYHLKTDGQDRPRFLLPTSESAILNIYRDEILPREKLPIKAFAYTPCYRRESGSHRTTERGTIRGHQFNKVEMFQFTTPDTAEEALAELVKKTETLVEKLGLHYQTSLLAAKDASASMAITYDVEVWLPSIGVYKEVSSASWAGDYQSRRANIRYKPEGSKKSVFVHTLNASGLATSRLLPAIVEQFQQEDGSVLVPEPLQPWLGTDCIKPPGK